MSKLTDVNLTILADTDCPSDWEREDLLEFAQEAAREILERRKDVPAIVLWMQKATEALGVKWPNGKVYPAVQMLTQCLVEGEWKKFR